MEASHEVAAVDAPTDGRSPMRVLYLDSDNARAARAHEIFEAELVHNVIVSSDSCVAYSQALASSVHYDAVLIASSLPDLDIATALRIASGARPCRPLLVAPTIGAIDPKIISQCGAFQLNVACDDETLPAAVRAVITEQRHQQVDNKTAAEHERRIRLLADRVDEVLWLCDPSGLKIEYLSPAFERVFGMPISEMYADPSKWRALIHADDRERLDDCFTKNALQGKEYECRYRVVRADGDIRSIFDHGYPILDDRGMVCAIGGIIRDETEQLQSERDSGTAEKMQAVGQLAAGIAHEINTPAQYVSDNLKFLADGMQDLISYLGEIDKLFSREDGQAVTGEELKKLKKAREAADLDFMLEEIPEAIEQASTGISRIAKIVRAMKEFSHPGGEHQENADLNRVIDSTVTVSRNEWKYVSELETELDPELPGVLCFPQEISQVVLNLIVNASHAIADTIANDDKGLIRVTTRRDGDDAVITVSDSGTGIPPELQTRVFEQFFTTKQVGKGTGQGLAMAYRTIVDNHGGTINLDSEVGKGSIFTLRLPIDGVNSKSTEIAA